MRRHRLLKCGLLDWLVLFLSAIGLPVWVWTVFGCGDSASFTSAQFGPSTVPTHDVQVRSYTAWRPQ